MMGLVGWFGEKILNALNYLADLYSLVHRSIISLPLIKKHDRQVAVQVILRQIIFTGIDAIPVISSIALMLGAIVIIQSVTQLPKVGGDEFIGKILVLVVIRELGPILTVFVVIGRSGSAIPTELGNMKINSEIEALEVMGIDLIRYIVMPRILGFVVSTVALVIYFDVVAIIGGFFISKMSITTYFLDFLIIIIKSLTFTDISISAVKGMVFGLTVAVVGCYHGLSVQRSITEVPQQTTKAIINSIIICFILNSLITIIGYI
jgi:phospholipid/cholesterol/gamma-HCH transport system permease protein